MSGMRILIVSDTHRRDGNFRRVLEKTGPIDMLIHLGDTEGSESYFREWVDNDVCVIHVVRGNNDFFSFCDREKEISIGRYRALLTHGHMYGVSLGTEGIKDEARARKVDIVMYGHTHKPHLEYCRDGLVVLNPGSLSYPRQEGSPICSWSWTARERPILPSVIWRMRTGTRSWSRWGSGDKRFRRNIKNLLKNL